MLERELAIFSPIPPEQNGIADYAYHLIAALQEITPCVSYANQPDGVLPAGVPIREPAQAFRHVRGGDPLLHQVGNNPGHCFVLEALRQWGGVTTLHDQNLHYLYEVSKSSQLLLTRNMHRTSDKMGSVFARHWFDEKIKSGANYALFDMLGEVLNLSTAVIVHSQFAKNRIRLLYGDEAASRVHVIPHLALAPGEQIDRDYLYGTLKVPAGVPLIVTSGFATAAKRFDWLVAALDQVAASGVEFFWVHAGKERPEEYDLSGLLEAHPNVRERTRITGYLTEDQLNTCVAACDVLVNLRFPSVGESSGTLARAMAAGRCCVVNGTAAYADLPADAAMHVPVRNTVPELVQGLLRLLADAELRAGFGQRALALARQEWAPAAVARGYVEVIAEYAAHPPRLPPPRRRRTDVQRLVFPIESPALREVIAEGTQGVHGNVDILLHADSAERLAAVSMERPRLFKEILPYDLQLRAVTVEPFQFSLDSHSGAAAYRGVALALRGVFE